MYNHDQLILKVFLNKKNNRFNSNRTRRIEQYPNIKEYLGNRYVDSFSLQETLNRIHYHIEKHPKCPVCGKYVNFKGTRNKLFETFCSNRCAQNSQITKQKIINTCLDRYGTTNPGASIQAQQKIKATLIKHYGVDNPAKSKIIMSKVKNTTIIRYGVDNTAKSIQAKEAYKTNMLKKYGVENAYQATEVKEKIKDTLLNRYGIDNPMKLEKFKQKNINTCLKKYGTTNGGGSKQAQEKIQNTKRKNHTFSTSKPEEQLYADILLIYPSVQRQYKDRQRYPYNCDFYISELDMFVELQGSWTHGKHPFSSTNKDDLYILEQWEKKVEEGHMFYKSAITTWTIKDPEKRQTAKKNNLNYVELFNKEDINLFLDELSLKAHSQVEQH